MLPKNADTLDLRTALLAIRLFLGKKDKSNDKVDEQDAGKDKEGKGEEYNEIWTLFLGVDEYQKIDEPFNPKAKAMPQEPNFLRLNSLLDTIVNVMLNAVTGLVLLPLFAGTDFEGTKSPASSSAHKTKRIPLSLLTQKEIEQAISDTECARVLDLAPCRRHLFYLGGVPRYPLEYAEMVNRSWPPDGDVPDPKSLERAYKSILEDIPTVWVQFTSFERLFLVAYSIVGTPVNVQDAVFPWKENSIRWSRLRDSSVCLIEDDKVHLHYPAFLNCVSLSFSGPQPVSVSPLQLKAAERFVETLQYLIEKVDNSVYDKAPWELWETFGACFHALRVNALIVLGKTSVKFSEIVSGTMVRKCEQMVNLRPVSVVHTSAQYSADLTDKLPVKAYPQKTFNWVSGTDDSYIVINGENREGVDIFFALPLHEEDGYVVCVDQRKRVAGCTLGPKAAKTLLVKEYQLPSFLQGQKTVLVRGLCSLFPHFCEPERGKQSKEQWKRELRNWREQLASLPDDVFILSKTTTSQYHRSLAVHPAADPSVNINYDNITTVRMVVVGNTAITDVMERRKQKPFLKVGELEKFVKEKGGELKDKDCIRFF